MYIVEVIPISRAVGVDTLSYFTSSSIEKGSLVDVPLRNKKVPAIVTGVRRAEDSKSEIKSAPYALKKLSRLKGKPFLTQAFMNSASRAADYYASTLGSTLDILLPDALTSVAQKLVQPSKSLSLRMGTVCEKYVMQGDDEERFGTYRSLIRQEFAKKSSVLIIEPTIEDAEYAYKLIEKGIGTYTILLTTDLPKKDLVASWNRMVTEKHPVAIVATPAFLSIPRPDISVIVVDKENGRGYHTQRRPYLDFRRVAEYIAEERGVSIFFADILLRAETLWRKSEGELLEAAPFKFRSLSTANDRVVDMKPKKNVTNNGSEDVKASFKILSDELHDLIKKTRDESEHLIILSARRGVAPATVCADCQNTVLCSVCSAPVVLHRIKESEKTFFMCHRCGERRTSEEYCKICGSWRLATIGIGIDMVEKKIRDTFPDITVFRIDSDVTPNEKEARAAAQRFKAKPGSVMVGTEMMLQYIHDLVENAAVASIDSLFALPDFRIQEKILYLITRMRAISTKDMLVQTRMGHEKLFEYATKGNLADFYRTTIDERKTYNYPPFTTLIKLTLDGKKEVIVKDMQDAQVILDPYVVEVFPAFTHTVRGDYVLHGLIRIPRERWIDQTLLSKLRSLPRSIAIRVDPETLL
jgi:primosomal protein N' (replication factor Y)